ncbi:MAG: hypothetical protein ACREPT_00390 [Rudaea sp.]
MAGKVFSGNVRITPVNVLGVAIAGAIGLLNTVKCELVTPAPENIDQISRQNGTVGQLVSRAQVPKPVTLNLQIDDTTDQRVLAYALNGVAVGYSQSSHTAVAVAYNAPATLGDSIPLGYRHVSSVLVKDVTDATTYSDVTDYLVDPVSGFIQVLASGIITANQVLHIGFTAAVIAGSTVRGSTVASNLLRIEVQLQDLVDGSEGYFVCPIFQASSSGNQDLFGKAMLVAGLGGAMFLPPAGSAAYTETGGAPYILTSIDPS